MEQIPFLNQYFKGEELLFLTNIIRMLRANPNDLLAFQLLETDNLIAKLVAMLMDVYGIKKTTITSTATYQKLLVYHSVRNELYVDCPFKYAKLLRMRGKALKLPLFPLQFKLTTDKISKLICLEGVEYPIHLRCIGFDDRFKRSVLKGNLRSVMFNVAQPNIMRVFPATIENMILDIVAMVEVDFTKFHKLTSLTICDYAHLDNLQTFCRFPIQLQHLTIRNFSNCVIVVDTLVKALPNLRSLTLFAKQLPIWHEEMLNQGFSLTNHSTKTIVYEKHT